jgi:hypothetical protein
VLTLRTFVFCQLEHLRESFKLIDYFVGPTGGVGYEVVDTDMTKFAVDSGACLDTFSEGLATRVSERL